MRSGRCRLRWLARRPSRLSHLVPDGTLYRGDCAAESVRGEPGSLEPVAYFHDQEIVFLEFQTELERRAEVAVHDFELRAVPLISVARALTTSAVYSPAASADISRPPGCFNRSSGLGSPRILSASLVIAVLNSVSRLGRRCRLNGSTVQDRLEMTHRSVRSPRTRARVCVPVRRVHTRTECRTSSRPMLQYAW